MIEQLYAALHNGKNILLLQSKLPILFQIAELESSRAGKIGMEVGTVREKIIIAFLIHVLGESNVNYNIPTTESEIDVKVFGKPLSIKTMTKSGGIKLIWTVDAFKALEFQNKYQPACDMILINIAWKDVNVSKKTIEESGFYYITLEDQKKSTSNYLRKRQIPEELILVKMA